MLEYLTIKDNIKFRFFNFKFQFQRLCILQQLKKQSLQKLLEAYNLSNVMK